MSKESEEIVGIYTIYKNELLGQGAQGSVYLATSSKDMEQYAAKIVKNTPQASQEMRLLLQASNSSRNVVAIYKVIPSEDRIVVVMERCRHNLADFLVPYGGRLPEALAQYYFVQLLSGLQEIHRQGIIHRDIKLENVFVTGNILKVGDFGLATAERSFDRAVGTPNYMTPQMLEKAAGKNEGSIYAAPAKFGPEVDVWAAGILLYRMVFGVFPTAKIGQNSSSVKENVEKICEFWGKSTPQELFEGKSVTISAQLRDLLGRILQKDPAARATLSQVLAHPWVTQGFLRYNVELDSLQGYYKAMQENFPSVLFRSTFDGTVRRSKTMIQTYYALKKYLQKKLDRSSYFAEVILHSRQLLSDLQLASGLPKYHKFRPNLQNFAVLHLLTLQRQVCFMASHNRYLKDPMALSIKIGQSADLIEELISRVCQQEFEGLQREAQQGILDKAVQYRQDLETVKKVFGTTLKIRDRQVIEVDVASLTKVNDAYADRFQKTVPVLASKVFLEAFHHIVAKIKTYVVYANKFQQNKGQKSMEELLVEIDLIKETENEGYFEQVAQGKPTETDPRVPPPDSNCGHGFVSPSTFLVVFVILLLAAVLTKVIFT